MRTWLLTIAVAGVVAYVAAATRADEKRSPNFVLIFTDDQGYQDVGCFGSPDIKTPNLDRMAAEGMRFTDFYSSAQVCTPSRASLMTGCYSDRIGMERVLFPKDNVGLNPSEITIAELLKGRGYATACVGKWHLGHLPMFLPTRQGFDSYFGIPYSNDMSIKRDDKSGPPVYRNEEIVEHPADQATLTKRYTEESLRFIEKNKDRPFFLYLPHTMPHVPLFASENFAGKSNRGLYGDVIEEIDWSVGQILDKLKQMKIDAQTLVVFTSDNGPWLIKGPHGGSALPLRAGKGTLYEGGMREPCIMRWPGKIPAGKVCGEVAATIDILPTFARLAGATLPAGDCPDFRAATGHDPRSLDGGPKMGLSPSPANRVIDGKDIWPLMAGEAGAKSPHEYYFYRRGAVRWGKWKYFAGGIIPPSPVAGDKGGEKGRQLYDLAADIGEKNNIAADHPEICEKLAAALAAHREELTKNYRPCGKVEKQ